MDSVYGLQRKRFGNKSVKEADDIIKSLNDIRTSINMVYESLNYSSDELITDSLNYELLALKSRHKYFVQRAKELNITFPKY